MTERLREKERGRSSICCLVYCPQPQQPGLAQPKAWSLKIHLGLHVLSWSPSSRASSAAFPSQEVRLEAEQLGLKLTPWYGKWAPQVLTYPSVLQQGFLFNYQV